ncbi:MAG: PaaI family thioesterase [Hydrogenophaga sp.]|nr:PaaI family thioesterase [Hydrogenophaga sp.]
MTESTTTIAPLTPVPVTTHTLQQALADWFAPWVQALGLTVESFSDGVVTLCLPHSDRLSRVGGMVCGQALMSAADTAMVLAIVTRLGNQRPMTTVQLNTSFLKPLSNQDALVTARIIRAGKSLVFGEIDISGARDGQSVCRARTTYALL